MIKISINELKKKSEERPAGYFELITSKGKIENGVLFLESRDYNEFVKRFSGHVGLGDKIASNPIIHAIGKATGCIDTKTDQLKPDSPCGKMRARLNAGMSVPEAMKLRLQGK